jgi:hypothetical protein
MAAVALQLLRKTVPANPWRNPATWPTWRGLLSHVLTITHRHPGSADEDVAWLLSRAAMYLRSRGEPKPARPLFERAFELYRRLLGEDHSDTLKSADNLRAVGEHQQARQLEEYVRAHRKG